MPDVREQGPSSTREHVLLSDREKILTLAQLLLLKEELVVAVSFSMPQMDNIPLRAPELYLLVCVFRGGSSHTLISENRVYLIYAPR